MSRLCLPLVLLALVACGGSSSESPWPREPENLDGDPSGEKAPEKDNVIDVTKLPNNYDDEDEGEPEEAPEDDDAE